MERGETIGAKRFKSGKGIMGNKSVPSNPSKEERIQMSHPFSFGAERWKHYFEKGKQGPRGVWVRNVWGEGGKDFLLGQLGGRERNSVDASPKKPLPLMERSRISSCLAKLGSKSEQSGKKRSRTSNLG